VKYQRIALIYEKMYFILYAWNNSVKGNYLIYHFIFHSSLIIKMADREERDKREREEREERERKEREAEEEKIAAMLTMERIMREYHDMVDKGFREISDKYK